MQLCVSIPAIRPLLAIYFPRLLESSRPPVRELKEIPDSHKDSELSDLTPTARPRLLEEKQGLGYFQPAREVRKKDVERGGTGSDDGKVTFGIHV